MIDEHLVRKAVISSLQADSTLVSLLGGNQYRIREEQSQAIDFTYPAITVDGGNQVPTGDGTRWILSRVFWNVKILSESDSGLQCDRISGQVFRVLFDTQINGTDENDVISFRFLKIDCTNRQSSLRIGRIWQAQIFFESELHNL